MGDNYLYTLKSQVAEGTVSRIQKVENIQENMYRLQANPLYGVVYKGLEQLLMLASVAGGQELKPIPVDSKVGYTHTNSSLVI